MSEYGGEGGEVNFDHRILFHYRIHTILSNCLDHSIKKEYRKWVYELYNLFREVMSLSDVKEEKRKEYSKRLQEFREIIDSNLIDDSLHDDLSNLEIEFREELQRNKFFLTVIKDTGRLL